MDDANAASQAHRRAELSWIAYYDREEMWRGDGVHSMTDWLAYQRSMPRREASQWVRVARALEHLPAIAEAYADGRLCWAKLVALSSFATPEEDARLADIAERDNYPTIEHMAKRRVRFSREKTEELLSRRYVRWRKDEDGSLRLNARFTADDGALVQAAIERVTDEIPYEPGQLVGSYEKRAADAFTQICSTSLAADADISKATILVHVGADELNHINGSAELDDGTPIPSETARRLACDARVQMIVDGIDGAPIGVGRVTRSIPPWLARQLKRRDHGCRFADCGRTRGLHAHHVIHWAHGGRTDMDNLVMLCPRHHRKVHEERWQLDMDAFGQVRVLRPDGRPLRKRRLRTWAEICRGVPARC
jgi:hypothetical protein